MLFCIPGKFENIAYNVIKYVVIIHMVMNEEEHVTFFLTIAKSRWYKIIE